MEICPCSLPPSYLASFSNSSSLRTCWDGDRGVRLEALEKKSKIISEVFSLFKPNIFKNSAHLFVDLNHASPSFLSWSWRNSPPLGDSIAHTGSANGARPIQPLACQPRRMDQGMLSRRQFYVSVVSWRDGIVNLIVINIAINRSNSS